MYESRKVRRYGNKERYSTSSKSTTKTPVEESPSPLPPSSSRTVVRMPPEHRRDARIVRRPARPEWRDYGSEDFFVDRSLPREKIIRVDNREYRAVPRPRTEDEYIQDFIDTDSTYIISEAVQEETIPDDFYRPPRRATVQRVRQQASRRPSRPATPYDYIECPRCGYLNPQGVQFCKRCDYQLYDVIKREPSFQEEEKDFFEEFYGY